MSTEMHTIRLRRPWVRQVEGVESSGRVDVPDTSSDQDETIGLVTYSRRFNQPTGLSDQGTSRPPTVWLWIESFDGSEAEVRLNDRVLDDSLTSTPAQFAISNHLQATNQLSIRIRPRDEQPPRLTGAVELRIEETSD